MKLSKEKIEMLNSDLILVPDGFTFEVCFSFVKRK